MTRDALSTLTSIAGWDEKRAKEVEFSGDADPNPADSLPYRRNGSRQPCRRRACRLRPMETPHRAQSAMSASMCGSATASLRSSKYMTMDGKSIAAERHPLMGVYPAKNGRWSYLHCNFPNHRAVALSVLGVEEEDNERGTESRLQVGRARTGGSDYRGRWRREEWFARWTSGRSIRKPPP